MKKLLKRDNRSLYECSFVTVDLIAVVSSQTLLAADQRGEGEEILHPEKSLII